MKIVSLLFSTGVSGMFGGKSSRVRLTENNGNNSDDEVCASTCKTNPNPQINSTTNANSCPSDIHLHMNSSKEEDSGEIQFRIKGCGCENDRSFNSKDSSQSDSSTTTISEAKIFSNNEVMKFDVSATSVATKLPVTDMSVAQESRSISRHKIQLVVEANSPVEKAIDPLWRGSMK